MSAPTVFRIPTRAWGEVPMIAIRMGSRVRLCATPDFEQTMGEQGKHCPAWFERSDADDPFSFDACLEAGRKELAP